MFSKLGLLCSALIFQYLYFPITLLITCNNQNIFSMAFDCWSNCDNITLHLIFEYNPIILFVIFLTYFKLSYRKSSLVTKILTSFLNSLTISKLRISTSLVKIPRAPHLHCKDSQWDLLRDELTSSYPSNHDILEKEIFQKW